MNDLFSLYGKTAVVTGCATGIGQEIALGLSKAGADIIALDIADLSSIKELIEKENGKISTYHVDLSKSQEINAAWKQILDENNKIDILCNNAGMQYRESAFDYPENVFDKIISVNVKSAFILSQKAANHFRSRGVKGKIINTASLFSTFGGMNVSGYTCSKHAVLGMTRAMSNEFSRYGICVNAIAPGYIQTNLTKAIWSNPEKRKTMDERIPIGRWGTPADFEGVAVFLASAASDYITGIMIPVDGGYTTK